MKAPFLIFVCVGLSACATRRAPVVKVTPYSVPGTTLPSEGVETVRYAENIKAYPLGRYIDPNNRRIMHEGHSVYRVESTAAWNLHPNAPVAVAIPLRNDAAKGGAPTGEELTVELNRQNEVTRAVMQGSQAVSQKLGELSANLQQTKQVAEENVRIEQELKATNQRLDLLEEELRKKQTKTPPIVRGQEEKSDW